MKFSVKIHSDSTISSKFMTILGVRFSETLLFLNLWTDKHVIKMDVGHRTNRAD